MREKELPEEDYTYEIAPGLTDEAMVSMIELSRHGYEVQFQGLNGSVLRTVGAFILLETDPDKYRDYFDEILWEVYERNLEQTNDVPKSAIDILLFIYTTDDVRTLPSEDLAEAYFHDIDTVVGNSLRLISDDTDFEDVFWADTIEIHENILNAATELYKRGFDFDDLRYAEVVNRYFYTLSKAIREAPEEQREEYYIKCKNALNLALSSEALACEFAERDLELTPKQFLFELVGASTPSISMDIIANLKEAEPDDKQLKKLAKKYKRNFSSLLSRDDYHSLTPLGKAAAERLGIHDDVALVLSVMHSMATTSDSLENFRPTKTIDIDPNKL